MLLQAAIGFGIFLMGIFFCLVFVVFPGLMIYFISRFRKERMAKNPSLKSKDIFLIIAKSILLSALIVIFIGAAIYFLLFATVDLTNT